MSGLCVVVDGAGARVLPEIVSRMADGAPRREPDGRTVRAAGPTAAAYQALRATVESAREEQPLVDEEAGLLLVADARIDDRAATVAELFPPGRDPTDAEVLLAAWRRWGEDCPAHLQGDFAFVVVDLRRRCVFAARDAFGVKPLHFARIGTRLLLASEARQILAASDVPCRLDETTVAEFLSWRFVDDGRTFFRDVRALPPGHRLRWDPWRLEVRDWWDPRGLPEVRHRRDSDYAAEYLEILRVAVRDRLRTGGSAVGIYLSGGLDSGSIAAVAAEELRGTPARLFAVTYAFDRLSECDERAYTLPLCRDLGIECRAFPVEDHGPLGGMDVDPADAETPFRWWESVHREMRQVLAAQGARVVLTGHTGDFGAVGHDRAAFLWRLLRGEARVLPEVLRHGRHLGLPVGRTVLNYLLKPALPGPLLAWLAARTGRPTAPDIPAWIPPALVRRAGLATRLREPSGLWRALHRESRATRRHWRHIGSVGNAVYWFDRREAEAGIEARHPLLDRRLAEYLARLPPRQVFRAGWTRWVVREALRGVLPENVRSRPDKTSYARHLEVGVREAAAARITAMFRDSHLERRGLIHGPTFRAALDQAIGGRRPVWDLLATIHTELWLTENHARHPRGDL